MRKTKREFLGGADDKTTKILDARVVSDYLFLRSTEETQ